MHNFNVDLNKLLRPILKARGNILYQLIQNWENITNPELNQISTPLKISYHTKGNILLIACHNQAVMTELHYLEPVILEKIGLFLGSYSIKKLKLQNKLIIKAPVETPVKIADELPSSVDSLLVEIDDPTLKQALTEWGQLFYGK